MRLSIDDIDLYCLGQRNTIPRDTIYSGVGYVYDSAGNVLYDSHAGLNLRYNQLNLIEKVMRGDTIVVKNSYLSDKYLAFGDGLRRQRSLLLGFFDIYQAWHSPDDGELRLHGRSFCCDSYGCRSPLFRDRPFAIR